ncbi:MAG: TonB-dependent receptor [Desulfobulbaceae bacterium]|nr:TonB-dependent receptor [Desulfobulbaceae bacterium]
MHIKACLFRFIPVQAAALSVGLCSCLIFSFVFLFTASHTSAAERSENDTLDILLAMNLEELVEVEVFSSSKRLQKISETASPIYVFTAEDIQRTGVRNFMELVKFIPGFYVYPKIDQSFRIVTRGINSSDKILFLIDGIPLNNIAQGGAVNMHLFPGLEKIKLVEIIQGPGSTMWGSDAALGIINIITRDAGDIDGHVAGVNYATEDNHVQVDALSGKAFDWGDYMLSVTYAENDGFGDERYGYRNYVHDGESIPWNDQRGNFNHIHPSYEIYGKLRYRDFTFKAYVAEKNQYSFWNTSQSTDYHDVQDKKSIHSSEDIHLELSHGAKLSNTMTLSTKLTAKKIDYTRDKVVEAGTNHGADFICDPDDPNDVCKEPIHDRTEVFPEEGVGLEFLLHWQMNEKNTLVAGTRARVVEAGPGEFRRFNINTGQPPANPNIEARTLLYEETTDTTVGAYVEDTYYATDHLTFIGGIRIDYNDPRETKSVVMPRGAAIYKFSDALSAKYMYNTGYVRPGMSKSFAVSINSEGSVRESEKIGSHDVALIYGTAKTQFTVDAYYMTIYDIYAYDATQRLHINEGDIFTQGVELLFKQSFFDGKLIFDLNYGYSTAEIEDEFGNKSNYLQGIPHHVYAAGLTYLFTDNISLTSNITGWRDLEMDNERVTAWYASPTHPDEYSGDYLVNFNLRFTDLFDDHLEVSLYVFNALDRDARLQALDSWHSWWSYERGRSVGFKASWKL